MQIDHLIMGSDLAKGSEGEKACLICHGDFSGCHPAFPQATRNVETNIAALQRFAGAKGHGKALCAVKIDAAAELTEGVKHLGPRM